MKQFNSEYLDRNLALEAVRVTEMAALASSLHMGRGNEKQAEGGNRAAAHQRLPQREDGRDPRREGSRAGRERRRNKAAKAASRGRVGGHQAGAREPKEGGGAAGGNRTQAACRAALSAREGARGEGSEG